MDYYAGTGATFFLCLRLGFFLLTGCCWSASKERNNCYCLLSRIFSYISRTCYLNESKSYRLIYLNSLTLMLSLPASMSDLFCYFICSLISSISNLLVGWRW